MLTSRDWSAGSADQRVGDDWPPFCVSTCLICLPADSVHGPCLIIRLGSGGVVIEAVNLGFRGTGGMMDWCKGWSAASEWIRGYHKRGEAVKTPHPTPNASVQFQLHVSYTVLPISPKLILCFRASTRAPLLLFPARPDVRAAYGELKLLSVRACLCLSRLHQRD